MDRMLIGSILFIFFYILIMQNSEPGETFESDFKMFKFW